MKQPFISILLAARNEAHQIERCLQSLTKQNYPSDCYEILVGNDASTDDTRQVVLNFAKLEKNTQLIDIEQVSAGKQNVLAQLAKHAKGNFFFFTDADMFLPNSWLKSVVDAFEDNTGVVVGCTTLEETSTYTSLQAIDWVFAESIMYFSSKKNKAITAMGNNMAVRKEAYWQTGGYDKLAFSLTEDYTLFKEICNKGWESKQLFESKVLGISKGVNTLGEWLHQRKRWMTGAMQHYFWLKTSLIFTLLVGTLLVAIFSPLTLGAVWLFKLVLQSIFIFKMAKKLELHFSPHHLILYEFYAFLSYFTLFIYYFLPISVRWKERVFT